MIPHVAQKNSPCDRSFRHMGWENQNVQSYSSLVPLPEFPISISGPCIIHFSCPGHNELATRFGRLGGDPQPGARSGKPVRPAGQGQWFKRNLGCTASRAHFADFAAHRQMQKMAVSTVNSNLRVLRRVLGLAVDWGVLDAIPKMKLLRGERIRDRVVSQEEERKYLAVAPEPLASIVTVLLDTGLRADECFRLRWEAISWMNAQHGTLAVTQGKSSAARRVLPMTPRVRAVLENRWLAARKPDAGYVWPAETSTGYIHDEMVRRAHLKVIKAAKVRHFVLHSIRHTFLTRLGESGCDVWTLARIAGHNSIKVSSRYVHPSEDAVQAAMQRLGGHKSGHNPLLQLPAGGESSSHASPY